MKKKSVKKSSLNQLDTKLERDLKKLNSHYANWDNFVKPKKKSIEKIENPVLVDIIESERGWGSKVDETKKFPNRKEAEEFCKEYNKDNNKDVVPDWYMVARIRGE